MGAEAARLSWLKLGDTFSSVHGLVANANSKSYGEKYKVAGILKPVHGPMIREFLLLWRAFGSTTSMGSRSSQSMLSMITIGM